MKKELLMVIIGFSTFTSCHYPEQPKTVKEKTTAVLALRQFVQDEQTTKTSSASFFLFCGNYSSIEANKAYLRVFAKVDGGYRFIEMPLEDVRVFLNDSLEKPTLVIRCISDAFFKLPATISDEELCGDIIANKRYIVSCPSRFLPEELIPLSLASLE